MTEGRGCKGNEGGESWQLAEEAEVVSRCSMSLENGKTNKVPALKAETAELLYSPGKCPLLSAVLRTVSQINLLREAGK